MKAGMTVLRWLLARMAQRRIRIIDAKLATLEQATQGDMLVSLRGTRDAWTRILSEMRQP